MKYLLLVFIFLITTISLAGNCPCPYNTDRRGRLCGKRSAFCKPGGLSPSCGTKSQAEFRKLFQQYCR